MMQGKPAWKAVLSKRLAARFAAVQALYQLDVTGAAPSSVVDEFVQHRLGAILEPLGLEIREPAVDEAFFRRLVLGVMSDRANIDATLSRSLSAEWSLDRCGFLLRACLRAAAFELSECADVPVRVVINEYVELAKLFLPDGEPAFVNAVLDKLGPRLRAPEAAL
jgi:transcription antitermination protein NusB